eukprot:gnl/MRDRNA2_/MRDRNA2_105749_c0_seq1.p1 gnl/MRDRNA2_/MRDRNA2_105749_c0~~gnl/MRDRNA2_/MRDRNA2_105749_c0_seq1.p1  ORF type:complete len:365 (-),score=47.15 gnl/MRDRNA2_/MRDRNA2_105749_c0_seq1:490-1584(-)
MKVSILALLSSIVVTQSFPRISHVTARSGCYRTSFAKGLPHGVIACARSNGQHSGTESRESLPTVPSTYHIGRRTMGALMGAGAFGLPLGYSKADSSEIKVVTFDGAEGTTQPWGEVDDTFASGSSAGKTFVSNGILTLDGTVGTTKQGFPGFLITRTGGDEGNSKKFPDVSSCEGISLMVKSASSYQGYHFSISNKAGNGYKAKFNAPLNNFGIVRIPFDDFTNSYNDVTGNPIKTCKESSINCLSFAPENLKKMGGVAFWAEGVAGKVKLEVKEISAYGCAPVEVGQPAAENLMKLDAVEGAGVATSSATTVKTEVTRGAAEAASNSRFLWLLGPSSLGLLVVFMAMHLQTRSALTVQPLLG